MVRRGQPHVTRGWLRVPYTGPSTARLTVGIDQLTPRRAFYDHDRSGSWAQVRIPEGARGHVTVTLRADGHLIGTWGVRL